MYARIALLSLCVLSLSACPSLRGIDIDPRVGYEQDQVELSGDFVTQAEKVEFNGNAVDPNPQIHPNKQDTITAIVPQGATTGFVKVHLKSQYQLNPPPPLETKTPFRVLTGTADDQTYARATRSEASATTGVPPGLVLDGGVMLNQPDWWKMEEPSGSPWAHTYEFTVQNPGDFAVLVHLYGSNPEPIQKLRVNGNKTRSMWITVRKDTSADLLLEVSTGSFSEEVPYQITVNRTRLKDVYEANNSKDQVEKNLTKHSIVDDEIIQAHLTPAINLATGAIVGLTDFYYIPQIGSCTELLISFSGLYENYPDHLVKLTLIAPAELGLPDQDAIATVPSDPKEKPKPHAYLVKDFPESSAGWFLKVSLTSKGAGLVPPPNPYGEGMAPGHALIASHIYVDSKNSKLITNPAYPSCYQQ